MLLMEEGEEGGRGGGGEGWWASDAQPRRRAGARRRRVERHVLERIDRPLFNLERKALMVGLEVVARVGSEQMTRQQRSSNLSILSNLKELGRRGEPAVGLVASGCVQLKAGSTQEAGAGARAVSCKLSRGRVLPCHRLPSRAQKRTHLLVEHAKLGALQPHGCRLFPGLGLGLLLGRRGLGHRRQRAAGAVRGRVARERQVA